MAASTPAVRVRRVHETPSPDDGVRVLVDRLRPRGLATADAHVDEWPRALTPSPELRHWYHGPEGGHEEFRRRYGAELAAPAAAEALARPKDLAGRGTVTLLTAVKDPSTGHASVLREEIEGTGE
ncbi:DUF488 domain-containing protein [Streptomyces sp. NPDC088915]|uniref:DUF488 domain-containing protein n=1 Tax=Streptomyces sp. NPDC088915 TaxID=3365912 RepID=UPI00382D337E